MRKLFLCLFVCIALAVADTCKAQSVSGSAVTVAWNPVLYPDGSLTYAVYYGTNTGNYFTNAPAGAGTSVTISNLVRGSTYYFAVVAQTTNGLVSSFSSEINYTAMPVPASPQGVRIILLSP